MAATNYQLASGVTTKIADAMVATGTNAFIFVVPAGPKNTRNIRLFARITGAVAAKGHLEYRPVDTDKDGNAISFVADGPADSLDFVAFASQTVPVMPGQYRLVLDTFTSTSIDVLATLD